MRKIVFIFFAVLVMGCSTVQVKNEPLKHITVKGQVFDFEGNAVSACDVMLMRKDFSNAYETKTDQNGYYTLENVEAGHYMALMAMRMEEYPRANAVPEEDMRLEFWAWNVVADRDLTINPRYQKLELYGTNVFKVMGGYNGVFVYFRPMSLTKVLSASKGVYLDKEKYEQEGPDLSVKPEYLDVKIYADDEQLKVNSVTPVQEYAGDISITGYIVQVDAPAVKTDKPYIVFRVEAENKENNEKGENIYFYEINDYK